MAWKLEILLDSGRTIEVDEKFETREYAEEEYNLWLEGWSAGGSVLMDAGESYSDEGIDSYYIYETND